MTYKEKTRILQKYLYSEKIDEFEILLQKIFEDKSPEAAECLIRALENKEDYISEMYQILHAVEEYNIDIYLKGFIMAFNEPIANPHWLRILFLRIMNNQLYFIKLKNIIKGLKPEVSSNLNKVSIISDIISKTEKERKKRKKTSINF